MESSGRACDRVSNQCCCRTRQTRPSSRAALGQNVSTWMISHDQFDLTWWAETLVSSKVGAAHCCFVSVIGAGFGFVLGHGWFVLQQQDCGRCLHHPNTHTHALTRCRFSRLPILSHQTVVPGTVGSVDFVGLRRAELPRLSSALYADRVERVNVCSARTGHSLDGHAWTQALLFFFYYYYDSFIYEYSYPRSAHAVGQLSRLQPPTTRSTSLP